jgi:phage major head subunit gpT-like protein
MDINKAGVSDFIFQNLKKDFAEGISEAEVISTPLMKTVPSNGSANVYAWLAHIPGFREMFRGQPRVFRNVENKSYTVPNRKFEDTVEIPLDDIEDNQIGQYSMAANQLGAAGKLVQDELLFECINGGFATIKTYDDVFLFSASHKVGISTVSNLGTLTLTADHLKTYINAMLGQTFKADKLSKARPLNPTAKNLILLVPPALKSTAEEIVLMRRNSYGADNVMFGAAVPMVSPYMSAASGGSDTAWALINVGASMKPFVLQEREKLQIILKTPQNSDRAFEYDSYVVGAKLRVAVAPTFPWLVFGSTGLAAS